MRLVRRLAKNDTLAEEEDEDEEEQQETRTKSRKGKRGGKRRKEKMEKERDEIWRQRSVHRYSHRHTCVAIDSPLCALSSLCVRKRRGEWYREADTAKKKRSCRSWLLLVPAAAAAGYASGDGLRIERARSSGCRARGRRPVGQSAGWTRRWKQRRRRQRGGGGEEEKAEKERRECVASPPR